MKMEQSMLEQSKGATYMSFILDVEVVIKKEGARANLAENKVKSKSQAPEKKEEGLKQVNENQTKSSASPDEVKVYSMITKPTHVFHEGYKSKTIENASLLMSKKMSNTGQIDNNDNNIYDEDKLKANVNTEDHVKVINQLNSILPTGSTNNINDKKRTKKKKIHKTDRKLRVFKGKVEPIDFLECNRIFMCNYLQIPKNNYHGILPYYLSFTSIIKTKTNTSQISTSTLGHKSGKADLSHTEPLINIKEDRVWKDTSITFSSLQSLFATNYNDCSVGDFNKEYTIHEYSTQNSSKKEDTRTKTSFSVKNMNMTGLYVRSIQLIKQPIDNKYSLFTQKHIVLNGQKPNLGCRYSNETLFYNYSRVNSLKKSLSLPNLDNCQTLVNVNNFLYKIDVPTYTNKSIVGKDMIFLKRQIHENENIIFINEDWRCLFISEPRRLNKIITHIKPQMEPTNKHTSVTNYISKHSHCNFQKVKEINDSVNYHTKSLENVNILDIEQFNNKYIVKQLYKNQHQATNELETLPQCKTVAQSSANTGNRRKRFHQILYNVLFKCITRKCKE